MPGHVPASVWKHLIVTVSAGAGTCPSQAHVRLNMEITASSHCQVLTLSSAGTRPSQVHFIDKLPTVCQQECKGRTTADPIAYKTACRARLQYKIVEAPDWQCGAMASTCDLPGHHQHPNPSNNIIFRDTPPAGDDIVKSAGTCPS